MVLFDPSTDQLPLLLGASSCDQENKHEKSVPLHDQILNIFVGGLKVIPKFAWMKAEINQIF